MSTTAYLALGSNQGDRRDYLERALQSLQEHSHIVVNQVSAYYETEPVGGPPGQGPYLNAAAEIETDLEPRELLRVLLEVEQSLGRVREERYGPRTIDLDLLLYGDCVLQDTELTVPHPRLQERLFVLQPLAEIAPEVVHPVLGRTIRELLLDLPATPLPVAEEGTETPTISSSSFSREPLASGGRKPPDDAALSGGLRPPLAKESRLADAKPGRELQGLRALVTGSTSGIGRAIALQLAAGGADVIIHGRSAPLAEEVAALAAAEGVRSLMLLADLRQLEECHRLVWNAWEAWDGLDIWINNAGIDTLTGEAAGWTFERKLMALLSVDVTSSIVLSRAAGERMKAQGRGVLLNMGWDQAETGMEGDSGQLFAAAKGAIMAFSKSLALSLAPQVRVNCLAPGWIKTAWGESASQPWQERVKRETPLRRWGRPEDVAAVARWLVSPGASYITGQIIRINGGAVR